METEVTQLDGVVPGKCLEWKSVFICFLPYTLCQPLLQILGKRDETEVDTSPCSHGAHIFLGPSDSNRIL